ncbi:hypothetical protein WJX84_005790 [Apatococcus fuscideae]|uniref:THO complex subunit 7 homolog n=1 Tax=Apatococcus fuscideae TaxID=2026836 RepID=A0AAW1SR66_9CHLO
MARSSQDEDGLIRKRLLYQASTTKGEPPFKKLAVRYVQFSRELEAGHAGRVKDAVDSVLQELCSIDFLGRKLLAVQDANLREQTSYKLKQAELEGSKEQAKMDIEAKKAELVQARIKRQQNEEYERLRDSCMKLQRRSDTDAAIKRLQEGIQHIEASTREVAQAEELQKKRFAVLVHYMSQLEGELEEEAEPNGEDSPAPTADYPTAQ